MPCNVIGVRVGNCGGSIFLGKTQQLNAQINTKLQVELLLRRQVKLLLSLLLHYYYYLFIFKKGILENIASVNMNYLVINNGN